MKNAPCARFGIRIRPKISENPDDNRNSRPPKATLLSVWMIQNCHCIDVRFPPTGCLLDQASRFFSLPPFGEGRGGAEPIPACSLPLPARNAAKLAQAAKAGLRCALIFALRLEITCRRVVARIDGILQELVLLISPELAHVGIGLDDRVDVSAALLLDLADVGVSDHVAQFIEAHRAADRVRSLRLFQRLHESRLVLDLAADRLDRRFQHFTAEVGFGGIDAGVDLVVAAYSLDEFLVAREVELG